MYVLSENKKDVLIAEVFEDGKNVTIPVIEKVTKDIVLDERLIEGEYNVINWDALYLWAGAKDGRKVNLYETDCDDYIEEEEPGSMTIEEDYAERMWEFNRERLAYY